MDVKGDEGELGLPGSPSDHTRPHPTSPCHTSPDLTAPGHATPRHASPYQVSLREDQTSLISQLDERFHGGKRRVMVQCATGWGKTYLAGGIIQRELESKRRTLFVVPAIGLIDQTVRVFRRFGIDGVGVVQATHSMTDWTQPVQVCSVQTLNRRKIPQAELVIIDEAHILHDFHAKWMLNPDWKDIPFIGLSATPWRKGLGAYYDDLLIAATTADMIRTGILCDFEVFAPASPDLKGVRTVAGDYHEGELSSRMNTKSLVADVVETWLRLGENRSTLCFAVDRAHAKHLQQQFEEAGVTAAYQDAYTKDDDREIIRMRFHSGEVKVVCSVGTLIMGIDWDVRCIIMARPTRSEIFHCQSIGRGLRTAENKARLRILDHSDNHLRLGFVTEIHHDSLNDGTSPLSSNTDAITLPKKCQQCSYLKPPKTAICPNCGFKAEAIDKTKVVDGQLIQLERGEKQTKARTLDMLGCETFYRQLLGAAAMKGYRPGWAYFKYQERFACRPENGWLAKGPISPGSELLNWVKSRDIRRAKRRLRHETRQHP